MSLTSYVPYAVFVVLSLVAGGLGSFYSFDGIGTWYATIVRPSWTPPSYLFGPVWTVLYVLMGLAAGYVYSATTGNTRFALIALFLVHLVVNGVWSYLFFGLEQPLWALYDIALLWVLIVSMMYLFFPYSRTATYLLIPYLAWVSYASTLNFGIYLLNK